jgi:hypothetical protein
MELTEEQRERSRKNRERALEIQRNKRKIREEEEEAKAKEKNAKKRKTDLTTGSGTSDTISSAMPLEDFEVGASEWVSKKEAMSTYCLPEGTLAVCECKERDNPLHKGWKPMKLFRRSEIRQRAHKRFDGMEGLVEERNMRRARKLAKDMKEAEKIFE